MPVSRIHRNQICYVIRVEEFADWSRIFQELRHMLESINTCGVVFFAYDIFVIQHQIVTCV